VHVSAKSAFDDLSVRCTAQAEGNGTDVGMVAVAILATGLLVENSAVWIPLAQNCASHTVGAALGW
jgi:hypothetical protein